MFKPFFKMFALGLSLALSSVHAEFAKNLEYFLPPVQPELKLLFEHEKEDVSFTSYFSKSESDKTGNRFIILVVDLNDKESQDFKSLMDKFVVQPFFNLVPLEESEDDCLFEANVKDESVEKAYMVGRAFKNDQCFALLLFSQERNFTEENQANVIESLKLAQIHNS